MRRIFCLSNLLDLKLRALFRFFPKGRRQFFRLFLKKGGEMLQQNI